ncbi:MAG TPA: hypothetical protein VE548_08485 [Nitrososphaeraceae archaeon]|nr:hypothetical protein [Nitrososphaeraceae archaeon]
MHYAKKHGVKDIPCIMCNNVSESDVALAHLIEIVHKREYTDEEKATEKAAVYKTIGIKPEINIASPTFTQ